MTPDGPDNGFECEICGEQFPTRAALDRHIKDIGLVS